MGCLHDEADMKQT